MIDVRLVLIDTIKANAEKILRASDSLCQTTYALHWRKASALSVPSQGYYLHRRDSERPESEWMGMSYGPNETDWEWSGDFEIFGPIPKGER